MNILITGKNSYIGESFKNYLSRFEHTIDEVDTISDEWKNLAASLWSAQSLSC